MNHLTLYITKSDQATSDATPLRIFLGDKFIGETTHYEINNAPAPVIPEPRKIYWDENGVAVRQLISYDSQAAFNAGISDHPHKVANILGMRVFKYYMDDMTNTAVMEVDLIPEGLPDYIQKMRPDWKFYDERHAETT